jgi:3-phenylpropionate/trans-cinnamate dioxygenase ferredoxin reductase subunit
MAQVVIIGAGHAGDATAAQLRRLGHDGPIVLIGDEPFPPYQRPPLSKAWLKGETDLDAIRLKPGEFYSEERIDVRTGVRATGIDRQTRAVLLSDGTSVAYDVAVIATGARAAALRVPGADLEGVLQLRSLADAQRLRETVGPDSRLAIVGGGYIGLEVAASARGLGAEVVLIEREARLLSRVAAPPVAQFIQARHEARGVRFLLSAGVEAFVGDEGRVCGVRLSDGALVHCTCALVGVGAAPEDALARAAGLACDGGVVVDQDARTSDPRVFAVGDVTRRPVLHHDGVRLESVPNAIEQARKAAAAILGRSVPPDEAPWFWSDQYDLKIQIAGLPLGCDRQVVRGAAETGSFAVFHLEGGLVRAVEAVNAPEAFVVGRRMISAGRAFDPAELTDASRPLKRLMQA